MKRKIQGLLSVISILAAGALWGMMGVFVRILTGWGFTTVQITAMRILVAAISFLVFLLIYDRSRLRIHVRDIWLFLVLGIGSVLFMSVCYFSTIQHTSLSVAAILLYTSPIFVMLMSVLFLKESFTARKLLALVCAFVGCVCVTGIGGNTGISGFGMLTGLLAGFLYALYSIFGTVALKKYHSYTVSAYAFFFAAAGEMVIGDLPGIGAKITEAANVWQILGVVILTALLTGFLPYLLYTYGLRSVEASKAAIMATVEPMVATLIGIVAFGEEMSFMSAAGIVLILLAILILNNFGRDQQHTS